MKQNMKILFLENIPSPYRIDFFNELGKLCDLTVTFEGLVATDRDKNWISKPTDNFKQIYLKGKRITNDSFLCPGIIKYLKQDWDKIIIGVYSTPTSILAIEYLRIKKIPFYIEADGGLIRPDSKLKYKIKKHFISSASAWFSSGKNTTEYLTYYGASREKCFIYPFTSLKEEDLFKATQITKKGKNYYKKKIGLKEERMLLSVGRFSYKEGYGKGYDILMSVAEKLDNNVAIYIVGEQPTEEFVKWKTQKKLDNIHFVGFKRKEELVDYYAAADVFVLMTRFDVWGLVINEAMAFGLPIVTTNRCVAGLELVKENVNGYVIPVNSEHLEGIIKSIINDDNLLCKLGENSLSIIKDYTIENMALTHIRILENENI